MQYPYLIKNGANTRNTNKFSLFFYHDHRHDTKECHALKKKIEKLIIKGYFHQFMKKETKPENKRMKVCTLDYLPQIK
jgi:hypothetical protein